ncbi:MAG: DUF4126 domain-containing protein [Thermoleophilia bacterium]
MAIAWAIGAAIGLSGLAGYRVFLPVATFMFMARMGWAWGFRVQDTPFDFLQSNAVIAVLVVLIVLEVLLSRIGPLQKVERSLRLPVAGAAGALLYPAVLSGEISGPAYFLGIPLGLVLALLGYYVYRGLMLVGEGRDPGPALDISVLFLSVVAMLLPPAGFVIAPVTIWLAVRVRRLKKMKYKGLRVLA